MSFYTKLPGVPDSDDAKPGMAYYAGTAPFPFEGRTCNTCGWRGYYRLAAKATRNRRTGVEERRSFWWGGCEMYRRLSAGRHSPSPVRPEWSACKYYEEKKR